MKLTFICSIFLAIAAHSTAQKTIDKIAAQVGDNVILLSDIQAQKIQAIQASVEMTPDFDCKVLEELMYQNLLINQAKLDSIDISDQQVDAEMESRLRVIENQIGGRDKMEEFYGKSVTQIKDEFRPIIRDQLLAKEMERVTTEQVTITPKEVSDFYDKIPADSIPFINAQLKFQQIVIYPEITGVDKDRAFQQLVEIRKSIVEDGKSFSTQARIHSTDPGSASKGGEIKASKGMMVPPFESAVFNLEVGQISDVFESEYGYHIVELLDRKGDDYTCRHILIAPQFENASIEAAAIRLDSCYRLLNDGKISWEDAVNEFSNDESTNQNNGTITNPITGEQLWSIEDLNQIDQQIYLLTNNLKKGDITEPNLYTNIIERKQGVRIVRLVERTQPHKANLTEDYSLIQRAAENDKKQRTINDWIQTKIKTTYVRINEPYTNCDFNQNWNKQ